MRSARLPRFRRALHVPPIMLTKRDRELIRLVHEHRFLRSTHLQSLAQGSFQQLLRRLKLLYHHGYLDRPRSQIDYYRHGSQAMVYGLGNKGMKLLEREGGIPHRKLDWTARNRSVTRYFIEHTLAVANAMVALELSCSKDHVQLIHTDHHHTVKWRVTIRLGGSSATFGVVPDRTFGLTGEDGTRWFFLEADRATMPVERNNLKQTSFYRKLLAYYETWRQGLLKDRFPRFRVLTVTTTPERARGLLESSRRLTQGKGSGLFLFTNQRVFNTREDVLQLRLLNGRGEEVRLLD